MTSLPRSLSRALPGFLQDRPLRLAAATMVLAVAAGLSLSADAAPPPHGPGMGRGMGSGMAGPGEIARMLDQVGASAEQRSQIKAIMASAHSDMKAQHEARSKLQTQMLQLFTQPTVDARAAETLRQQMLAQHDQASKRQMQAMIDASRVLSADQRKQFGEQMGQRRTMMERHRSEREALDKPVTR